MGARKKKSPAPARHTIPCPPAGIPLEDMIGKRIVAKGEPWDGGEVVAVDSLNNTLTIEVQP